MPSLVKTIAFVDSTYLSNGTLTGNSSGTNNLSEYTWPNPSSRVKPLPSTIRAWGDKTAYQRYSILNKLQYRKRINLKNSSGGYLLGSINSHFPLTTLSGLSGRGVDVSQLTIPATTGELNRVRAKLSQRGVNIAQMLGEYKQTASLFSELAPDLVRLTKAFVTKSPRLLFGNKKLHQVSGHVLKYQYGARPLVQDMHDSLAALRRRLLDDVYYQERVAFKRSLETGWTQIATIPYPNNLYVENLAYRVSGFVQGHVYGRVKMDRSLLFNSLGTFGLTNPASLAWELLPWSFVVDWFVNVGNVLASMDNTLFYSDFRWYVASTQYYAINYKSPKNAVQLNDVDLGYHLTSNYRRSAPSAASMVQQLEWSPSSSYSRVVNGLALIGQFLSGRR